MFIELLGQRCSGWLRPACWMSRGWHALVLSRTCSPRQSSNLQRLICAGLELLETEGRLCQAERCGSQAAATQAMVKVCGWCGVCLGGGGGQRVHPASAVPSSAVPVMELRVGQGAGTGCPAATPPVGTACLQSTCVPGAVRNLSTERSPNPASGPLTRQHAHRIQCCQCRWAQRRTCLSM